MLRIYTFTMQNTRARLEKAALELFLQKGYARTTIGQIEAAAGLAPRTGTFYRHFKNKAELISELARSEITETPEKFDLERLLELGDTRAEMVPIAQTYEQFAAKQAPFLELIEELRRTEEGAAFESEVNADMLDALTGWVASKPGASQLSGEKLLALTMMIFGGWLFFLFKSQQGVFSEKLGRGAMIEEWSTYWASELDADGR